MEERSEDSSSARSQESYGPEELPSTAVRHPIPAEADPGGRSVIVVTRGEVARQVKVSPAPQKSPEASAKSKLDMLLKCYQFNSI